MNKITYILQGIKAYAGSRWELLSNRDKKISMALIAILLVLFIYFLVIAPISHWKNSEQKRLAIAREDSLFVKKHLPTAEQAQEKQKNIIRAGGVGSLISNSARTLGISFSKTQPTQGSTALWIEQISYHQLINWLVHLHNEAGLKVRQIRLEKIESASGMVKVFLKLGN